MNISARREDGSSKGSLPQLHELEKGTTTSVVMSLAEAARVAQKAAAASKAKQVAAAKNIGKKQEQDTITKSTTSRPAVNAIKALSSMNPAKQPQEAEDEEEDEQQQQQRRTSVLGESSSGGKAERRAQLMDEMGDDSLTFLLAATRTTLSTKRLSLDQHQHDGEGSSGSFSGGVGVDSEALAADNQKLVQRIRSVRNLIPKDADATPNSSSRPSKQRGEHLKRLGSKKRLTSSSNSNKEGGVDKEKSRSPRRSDSRRGGLSGSNHNKKMTSDMRRCKTVDEGRVRKKQLEELEEKEAATKGGRLRRARRVQSQPEGVLIAPAAAIAKQQLLEQGDSPDQKPRQSRCHPNRDVRSSQIHQALKEQTGSSPEESTEEKKDEEDQVQKQAIVEEKEQERQQEEKQDEDVVSNQRRSLVLPSMSQFVPRFSFGLMRGDYGQMDDSSRGNHFVEEKKNDDPDSSFSDLVKTRHNNNNNNTTDESHTSYTADESSSSATGWNDSESSTTFHHGAGEDNLIPTNTMTLSPISESHSPSSIRRLRDRQRRGLSRKSGVASSSSTSNRRQSSKRRLLVVTSEEDALPQLVH